MAIPLPHLSPQPTTQAPSSPLQAPNDPDQYAEQHVKGYPLLAYWFAQHPRALHLRRFSALSVRMLLHHQHRLVDLEDKLLKRENEDAASKETDKRMRVKDFKFLNNERVVDGESANTQGALYKEINATLKDYEDALIRFNALGTRRWDFFLIEQVQHCLASPDGCDLALRGKDGHVWGTTAHPRSFAPDMIQVIQQNDPGFFRTYLLGKMDAWVLQRLRLRGWMGLQSNPDRFKGFSHSLSTWYAVASIIGNSATLLIFSSFLGVLYVLEGTDPRLMIALVTSLVAILSYYIFKNETFLTQVAVIFAVTVPQLTNNNCKNNV
ncbi:hypothetical protein EJ04DRAFT_580063 [Polyplosphaeria fusca]|uniref:DUF6594 domain-containing protein n=1 Tax=Polyplosphaeria fusca TaxID=682080 RepID=A0A9P4QRL4_9PLEO|nr:hypothetical protein EJ04DRAFT_580063 [Polyplosphaeria fusca]